PPSPKRARRPTRRRSRRVSSRSTGRARPTTCSRWCASTGPTRASGGGGSRLVEGQPDRRRGAPRECPPVTDAWDPEQYHRFAAERRPPFDDLKSMCMPVAGGRIVDLGCGSGELTAELHRDLRAAETLGVDRSEAMLADATRWANEVPGLRFELGDLSTWHGSGVDLVFANASLHWVPDHDRLLSRLRASLAPGGQLAFQVPATFSHPSHVLAAEVAAEPPFAAAGNEVARPGNAVLTPARYAEILHSLGAVQQSVRLQVYGHLLAS